MAKAREHPTEAPARSDRPQVLEIRAEGLLTRIDRQILSVVLLLSPVDVILIVFLTNGGWQSDTSLKLGFAIATVVLTALLLTEVVSNPRRVYLSSRGLTIRYRLHSERADWGDMRPSVAPAKGVYSGSWHVSKQQILPSGRVRRRAFLFTPKQARAVLRYPSGRKWDMTPDVQQLVTPGVADETA